ncbi:MAG: hypothetical protein RBU37_25230, partial [Myxococcota bacterium]|nr:hypothetical protein [Myxococcota bacterium]
MQRHPSDSFPALSRKLRWPALYPARLAFLALALSIGLGSATALGQTPKAYMSDFVGYEGQVADHLREQVSRAVRQRLEADPSVELQAKLVEGAKTTNPAIVEARRLYESGRAQYVDQRFSEASSSLLQALDYFEKNVSDIDDWAMLGKLLYRLSTAQFQAGMQQEASETMRRLLSFDPTFELSLEEELPEAYRLAFADEKKNAASKGSGSIDTSAIEAGAEVWVDGELRGVAPLSIEPVAPGSHFLVLRSATGVFGSMIVVEAKKATVASVSLVATAAESPEIALQNALRDGVVGDDVRLAVRDLASRTAASFIVFGIIVPMDDGLALRPYVYDVSKSSLRGLEHVVFDRDLLSVNVDGYKVARAIIDALFDDKKGELIEGSSTFSPATFAPVVVTDPVVKDPVVTDPVVKDPVVV